jgi:hypothetical protein
MLDGDWSSDVCSSDLNIMPAVNRFILSITIGMNASMFHAIKNGTATIEMSVKTITETIIMEIKSMKARVTDIIIKVFTYGNHIRT